LVREAEENRKNHRVAISKKKKKKNVKGKGPPCRFVSDARGANFPFKEGVQARQKREKRDGK